MDKEAVVGAKWAESYAFPREIFKTGTALVALPKNFLFLPITTFPFHPHLSRGL